MAKLGGPPSSQWAALATVGAGQRLHKAAKILEIGLVGGEGFRVASGEEEVNEPGSTPARTAARQRVEGERSWS